MHLDNENATISQSVNKPESPKVLINQNLPELLKFSNSISILYVNKSA